MMEFAGIFVLSIVVIVQWVWIKMLRDENDDRRLEKHNIARAHEVALELAENIINSQADTIQALQVQPPIHQPRIDITWQDAPDDWGRCF